jgi:DNA-binding MarR family transcriptional regulator
MGHAEYRGSARALRGKGDVTGDDERAALFAAIESHGTEIRRVMSRAGADHLLGSGLTMQQFRVVMLLSQDGPLPHSELAHALGVSLASVTGLVDRLAARGIVERTPSPADGRVRLAGLTAQGLTLAEQVTTEGRTLLHTLLRAVDTEALRGLEQGLAALRGAIGHEGP